MPANKGRNRAKPITVKLDRRSESSPSNAKKGGRPPAPPPMGTALKILEKEFMRHSENTPDIIHHRGEWNRYNSRGWIYESEEDIRKRVMTFLQNEEDYGPHATPNYVSSVIEHMKAFNLCGIPASTEVPTWLDEGGSAKNWMAFKNGVAINVVALASGKPVKDWKRKVSPTLYSRDYVDYDYNPKGKCPRFLTFLNTSLPSKDSQDLLQEMTGLMLADITYFENFFFLYGPTSRNGKTVYFNILASLVGKHNVSHVILANLTERFETWPLAEAKVNICGDMATDIGKGKPQMEGIFKDLISGGMIEYQKKGKDKYNAPCRARFAFAGNSLPTFVDRSDAIWERLRIIHFSVQIIASKRDPNLADKIIASERSGIFNWAIKGLARAIKRGRIIDTEEGIRIKAGHRLECDHEKMFIEEHGLKKGNKNDTVHMNQLYQIYKQWMFDNGFMNKGSGKFYQRIEALIPGVVRGRKRIEGMNSAVQVFIGLKVK